MQRVEQHSGLWEVPLPSSITTSARVIWAICPACDRSRVCSRRAGVVLLQRHSRGRRQQVPVEPKPSGMHARLTFPSPLILNRVGERGTGGHDRANRSPENTQREPPGKKLR